MNKWNLPQKSKLLTWNHRVAAQWSTCRLNTYVVLHRRGGLFRIYSPLPWSLYSPSLFCVCRSLTVQPAEPQSWRCFISCQSSASIKLMDPFSSLSPLSASSVANTLKRSYASRWYIMVLARALIFPPSSFFPVNQIINEISASIEHFINIL